MAGLLSDNDSATWEWNDDNACWGNGGYGSFVYGGIESVTGNSWWGITSDGIADQITDYGYGFNDGEGATMTFTSDGILTKSSGGSRVTTYYGYAYFLTAGDYYILSSTADFQIIFNGRYIYEREDFTVSVTELDKTCGQLLARNPGNTLAMQYLLVYPLLEHDLDSFMSYFGYVNSQVRYNPAVCQEAVAFAYMQKKVDGLPG